MIKEISKSVLLLAFAMLAVVASGCNDNDDGNFPEKDGQLPVTKVETQTNYVDYSFQRHSRATIRSRVFARFFFGRLPVEN